MRKSIQMNMPLTVLDRLTNSTEIHGNDPFRAFTSGKKSRPFSLALD
jgi:hypothetical protein